MRKWILLGLLIAQAGLAQDTSWADMAALPQLAPATPATTALATPARFHAALAGRWRGGLTYRDYRSDKRVTLPTSAAITDDNGSAALQVAYVYDDGPGKTVRSGEDWELSADRRRLRLGKDQLAVSDYQAGAGLDITLVALGSGTDNDAPVQVRMVLMRRGDQLRISRATQSPGQPWLLRHIYQFTRDQ